MSACPTPEKVPFTSRAHAVTDGKRAAASVQSGHRRPYLCECGYWHLSHMTKQERKRVAKRASS